MNEQHLLDLLRELGKPVRRPELMRLSGFYAEDLLAALDALVLRGDVERVDDKYRAVERKPEPVKSPYQPDWCGTEWKPDTFTHWHRCMESRKMGIS
ncbi:hypothetical protein [Cupriavidus sp. UYPR2.512]|uniref:hypothetical protein n=1 Tax=Cupriavidus sp. UYPR2.512 TaxID=1080187 RepID=UPI00037A613E|nr:hypothetical protein [Cupriavidus sp. UYPR2.512]UIF90906.1 hypothetical protein KAF44_32490 [Cupriavidus necator]